MQTAGTEMLEDCIEALIDFNRGHQPINNWVKEPNADLIADSHNILDRWKCHFCHCQVYVWLMVLGKWKHGTCNRDVFT
jgi:hypothetical protein